MYFANQDSNSEAAPVDQLFLSECDMAFTYWISNCNLSSGKVEKFLEEAAMKPMHDMLNWETNEARLRTMDNLGTSTSQKLGRYCSADIEVPSSRTVGGVEIYTMRHRMVLDAVRFLLGHRGFKDDLVYAPYQDWTVVPGEPSRRVYTGMASADMWWETQLQLPGEGNTVVPLVIASDKTQVTNHAGDLTAHAVYLSIGNLRAHARNANDRPGSILLAMMPCVKEKDPDVQDRLFHECLRTLFDPVKQVSNRYGMEVECADGWVRQCFPVIAALVVDYEEQAKLTGVKSGRHCTICKIDPDFREDLERPTILRTHADTAAAIIRQKEKQLPNNDKARVHDVRCFAWGHKYVNIHQAIMADTLHQLLKGVLMHVFKWLNAMLADEYKVVVDIMMKKGRRRGRAILVAAADTHGSTYKKITEERLLEMIDKRFASMPSYGGLRKFKRISSVTQWTGKEQKDVLRQMLPAYVPLLADLKTSRSTEAIRFLRACVDFITLAQYRSHDTHTLQFMTMALFRMNQTKEAFRRYRGKKDEGGIWCEDGHFNFPKFHAIVHYTDQIQWLGNATDLETGHFEYDHRRFIKDFFKNTNKRKGWEDQVMAHYRRWLNMAAEMDISGLTRKKNAAEVRAGKEELPNEATGAICVVEEFGWPRGPGRSTGRRLKKDILRTVGQVEELLGEELGQHFRQAAASFITARREADRQATLSPNPDGTRNTAPLSNPDRLIRDDDWVRGIPLKFHNSIRVSRPTTEDPDDPDKVLREYVRCCQNWQGERGNVRQDFAWVQEYRAPDDEEAGSGAQAGKLAFNGKRPVQVLYTVTFMDSVSFKDGEGQGGVDFDAVPWDHELKARGRAGQYTGAFVDMFKAKFTGGVADEDHGMTVIVPMPLDAKRYRLGARRFVELGHIGYSIHCVPVDETVVRGERYINNTSDFEAYNGLWNVDWDMKVMRQAVDSKAERLRLARGRSHRA